MISCGVRARLKSSASPRLSPRSNKKKSPKIDKKVKEIVEQESVYPILHFMPHLCHVSFLFMFQLTSYAALPYLKGSTFDSIVVCAFLCICDFDPSSPTYDVHAGA